VFDTFTYINNVTTLIDAQSVINWQVGDSADYNLSITGYTGTLHEEVTKNETPTQVWFEEVANIAGQNQTEEILLDRNTGKVLRLIENGQEQTVPNDDVTIIAHDQESVTVPAGTFQVQHITARNNQSPHIELYLNPNDITVGGVAKEVTQTQYGDMTIELTAQKHGGGGYVWY
jgi:hypothetical protein